MDILVLYLRHFTKSFDVEVHTEPQFFQLLFPFHGNIIAGMVACYKEQGNKYHLADFHLFHLSDSSVESGIAFDGGDMIVGMALRAQHIVELAVKGGGRAFRAVSHKQHMLMFLDICRMTGCEDAADLFCILNRIE